MQLSIFDNLWDTDVTREEKAALIIDGDNLLNRAFYATRGSLKKASNGKHTNGIDLFLKMMIRYKMDLNITHLAVTFDKTRGFRQELYPGYKGSRKEKPEELTEQFPLLEEILKAMNVPVFVDEVTYEADDLIAALAKKLEPDMKVYLLSNDEDLLQLVSDRIIQIRRIGKDDIFYDGEYFQGEYDLLPKQMIDLKGLMGDTSDEYPGVPGIGEKGAIKLLKRYGTVEAIFDNLPTLPKELNRYKTKLEDGQEEGLLSKKLATLVNEIKVIDEIGEILVDWKVSSLIDYCYELELNTLRNQLEQGRY